MSRMIRGERELATSAAHAASMGGDLGSGRALGALDGLDPGAGGGGDHVPARILAQHGLVGLGDALRGVHAPSSAAEAERARACRQQGDDAVRVA